MRIILLLTTFFIGFLTNAQTCTNCKTEYHNYTGDIHVKNNEEACITGTFSGNIEFNGGKLTICGNAQIGSLNYKQPASMIISEGARVKIQSINSNKEVFITNYCDSFVIQNGNFNQPFKLVNNGKAYIQSGTFNGKQTFLNDGKLVFNTSLMINAAGSEISNTNYLEINGGFTTNTSNLLFNNACQLRVNGDFSSNGAILNLKHGYTKVNNCVLNGGAIIMNDASIFEVNNLNLNGYIEGTGARSKVICIQNPNLNGNPSVKGEISLCVKTGNYNPNPGVIQDPAKLDCEYQVGLTECHTTAVTGYSHFRMLPGVISQNWKDESIWEVWDNKNNQFVPAPSGAYPTKGSSVIINNNNEITVTSSEEIMSLYLGHATNSAKLKLSPGVSFTITDTVIQIGNSLLETNNGTFAIQGHLLSNLNIKGSANGAVTIDAETFNKSLSMDQSDPGVSNALYALTLNNPLGTLTLTDTLMINRMLNPTSGTIQTNGKLVLHSDKNYTASIGPGVGTYIVGKVKVQRYIPAIARRFRFVSPTIQNATLLDWQDDVFVTGNNAAGNATGQQVGTLNSAGFDANQSFQPSLYRYDETKLGSQNNGWVAATNETNTLADYPLPVGKGYRLFIRGDRSDTNRLNGQNNIQNEVTLDMYGDLIMGDVTVPITYTSTGNNSEDGWNLIGNPYASAYNWKAFYEENGLSNQFEPIVWVYDSKTNAYVSYNVLSNAGSFTNGIIPSGQSFWVKATAPTASITLKEKYKIASVQNDAIRLNTFGTVHTDELSIKLVKDSVNQDEMIIKYVNGSSKGVDPFDIDKFWSDAVGIAQYADSGAAYLDLSCRPIDYHHADFIPIYYFVNENGQYSLNMKMSAADIYNGPKAYLLDAELNQYIDIATQPVYNFTVNLFNPSAGQSNRFYIVYFPSDPPVTLLNYLFAEKQDTTGVYLTWGSLRESLPTKYVVQRGYASNSFTTIALMDGVGSFDEPSDYELLDTTADLRRDLYYRIGTQDSINAQITYSPIIYLPFLNTGLNTKASSLKDELKVFPIPAQNILTLEYRDGALHGVINVSMVDITGKEVVKTQLGEPMPGNKTLQLDISELSSGLYFMNISNANGDKMRVKVIKN